MRVKNLVTNTAADMQEFCLSADFDSKWVHATACDLSSLNEHSLTSLCAVVASVTVSCGQSDADHFGRVIAERHLVLKFGRTTDRGALHRDCECESIRRFVTNTEVSLCSSPVLKDLQEVEVKESSWEKGGCEDRTPMQNTKIPT